MAVSSTFFAADSLDAADRRIGAALPDGSAWDYGYDDLGQLTSAQRDSINAMAYAYDTIGNRQTATEDGTSTTYTANDLNQYTAVNSGIPTYDADGNMLSWAGWTYHWNAENRLIRAENGPLKVEADYDYMGRRFEKKVFYGNTLTQHQYFLYDGYKLAAITDALNDDQITTAFTWQPTGPDTPLTMTYKGVTGYYLTDGNKNVLKVLRSDGTELATYTYGPFGHTLSMTGPWAQVNPFRFSSEYHDDETALIYYIYRHYSPGLGRWLSRDPIEEQGGVNLYAMVGNDPVNKWDNVGKNPGSLGAVFGDLRGRAAEVATVPPCAPGAKTRTILGITQQRTQKQSTPPFSNGCGPLGFGWAIPNLHFGPACDNHDFCYGTCGKIKSDCEDAFLRDMLAICFRLYPPMSRARRSCDNFAHIYFDAVSNKGANAFENSQDKHCTWERCCP